MKMILLHYYYCSMNVFVIPILLLVKVELILAGVYAVQIIII